MKCLKTLGLAAVVAMALTVFAGANSASATVLCKTTTNPCTSDYAAGTEIKSQLVKETEAFFRSTSGEILLSCKKSSLNGTTSNTGVEFFSVLGSFSTFSFSECSRTVDTINKGSFGIAWALGGSGEVWGKNNEVTFNLFGVSCTYGTGEGTTLGLTNEPATNTSHAVLPLLNWFPKVAGGILCPSELSWAAEYTITAPVPLYVANS